MAVRTFVYVDSPGKTLTILFQRASDGYFWNPTTKAWQVSSISVSMTEVVDYSDSYSEYYSDTEPTEHCFWKITDDSDIFLRRGEYWGVGQPSAGTGPAGYPSFSDAYTEVKTDVDGLVGTAEAKRIVNECLRIVANDRHWEWKVDDDPYTLTTVASTEQYTLPISVKQVIGAYSDKYRKFGIYQYPEFALLHFNNRTSGVPNKLYLIGQNVVMPDPIPDDAYSIYLIYQKQFALSEDSDTFPCPHDFVDCIKSMAKWMAADRKGKSELANSFEKTYKMQLHSLRTAEMSGEFFVPGEPGYGMGSR